MSDSSLPAPTDGRFAPLESQTQWRADFTKVIDEEGRANKRIFNSVISGGNLVSKGGTLAAKGLLGTLNPVAALGVLTSGATEAVTLALEYQHRAHGIHLDSTASLSLEAAVPMVEARTQAFLEAMRNDPRITTPAEAMRAFSDMQKGFKAAEKWWLVGPKLFVQTQPMSDYYRLGLKHGHEVNRLFRDDPSWKGVSAKLLEERDLRAGAQIAAMFAGQIQGAASGVSGAPALGGSVPTAPGSGGSASTSAPSGASSSSTSGTSSGSLTSGAGVNDVRALTYRGVAQVRAALLLAGQALDALDAATTIFTQGSDGSSEQAPKDVLASYRAADADVRSASQQMRSAEAKAIEWAAGL